MPANFEVRPLHTFTREEVWPLLSGYDTDEIYAVEKSESDARILFDMRLTRLERPFHDDFYADFTPQECAWYQSLAAKGGALGAYQGERWIGLAIGEALPEERHFRVWEFHVLAGFRRGGVGRALMAGMERLARAVQLPALMLETQNTNAGAVRFYRSMGFTLESIDLSPPQYASLGERNAGQVAFYMKRRLE